MARQVSPPKQSGGGGFAFEDKVGAYLLTQLLCSSSPLPLELGHIKRIKFQVRHLGWLLDDILLTLDDAAQERQCAISIKSSRQITSAGVPADLVADAWGTYLSVEQAPFKRGRDLLALASPPAGPSVHPSHHSLVRKARTHDAAALKAELEVPRYANDVERNMLRSFTCPEVLATHSDAEAIRPGDLLASMRFIEFDFEDEPSRDIAVAVERCQRILREATPESALALWERLLELAKEFRVAGGELDLPELRAALGTRFELADFPNYASDWRRVREHTKERLAQIPNRIGGVVRLGREEIISSVEQKLDEHQACVLVGDSGAGKTVIARSLAERRGGLQDVVWLDASKDASEGTDQLRQQLGLAHSWTELWEAPASCSPLVIIDGIDRVLTQDGLRQLAAALLPVRAAVRISGLELLVTCTADDWSRVQRELIRFDLDAVLWPIETVAELTEEELGQVLDAIPQIRPLALRRELRPLLGRPKIIDLLAVPIQQGHLPDTRPWVGESDLIEWYWCSEILEQASGATDDAFLMKLGEIQADELRAEVPKSRFDSGEIVLSNRLIERRLCRDDHGRLSFSHDLLSDWARFRCLMMHEADLPEFLGERCHSVLWHRALRLYGLDLIERRNDPAAWVRLLADFDERGEPFAVARDQLLDALFHAVDSLSVMERVWREWGPTRESHLRRLLVRFLHVATTPNPQYALLGGAVSSELGSLAETLDRVPIWSLWFGVLSFLDSHGDEAVRVAIQPLAQIAHSWLTHTPPDYPRRQEAANLAMACLRLVVAEGRQGTYRGGADYAKLAYRAGLAAAPDLPEEMRALARRIVARDHGLNGTDTPNSEQREDGVESRFDQFEGITGERLEHFAGWPEGPGCRVDRAFREACLETDALVPVMGSDPDLASELILAVLLGEPGRRSSRREFDRLHYDFGLADHYRGFPPFYTKGPFLRFLQVNPRAGIMTIVALVNFVTERWAEFLRDHDQDVPVIDLPTDEERNAWVGDAQVYFWYRDAGRAPHIVVSALMALEKWLYMRNDANEDLSESLELILREGRSIAFLGVLNALGKVKSDCFLGELRPLMGVPEFHDWEERHVIAGEGFQMIGWGLGQPEVLTRLATEWNSLPSRRANLKQGWLRLFVLSEDYRVAFREFRDAWAQRLDSADPESYEHEFLETLVSHYDEANWRRVSSTDGEGWQFEPPVALARRAERMSGELEVRQLLTLVPLQCSQLLEATEPPTPEQIAQVQEAGKRLESIVRDRGLDREHGEVASARSAVDAVLIRFAEVAATLTAAEVKAAEQRILAQIESLHSDGRDDPFGPWQSEQFCVQVIPEIWLRDLESERVRSAIGVLLTAVDSYHDYKLVGTLCTNLARRRAELGDDFWRVMSLGVRVAVRRDEHRRAERRRDLLASADSASQQELDRWIQEAIADFAQGGSTTDVPSLATYAQGQCERRAGASRGRPGEVPQGEYGFDTGLVQAVLGWLPLPSFAANPGERSRSIAFWKDAVQTVVWTLSVAGEEETIDGTPYAFDHWALQSAAVAAIQLDDDEGREDLWRPIVGISEKATYWVEDWFTGFFSIDAVDQSLQAKIAAVWRSVLDFVFACPAWQSEGARRWFRLEDLWCYVIGLTPTMRYHWIEGTEPLLEAMRDQLSRWAAANLDRPRCARRYLDFLSLPGARNLRLEGLQLVAQAVERRGGDLWSDRHEDSDQALAEFLDTCFRSHGTNITSDTAHTDAFQQLLAKLVARQNAHALVVRDRLEAHLRC